MAAKKNTSTATTEEKKTRKVSTPAERIAKLKADLEKAEARATSKQRKELDVLTEYNTQIDERIASLVEKREANAQRIQELQVELGIDVAEGHDANQLTIDEHLDNEE